MKYERITKHSKLNLNFNTNKCVGRSDVEHYFPNSFSIGCFSALRIPFS